MTDNIVQFKTHPDVVVTVLDGENESVLLHMGTKKYYSLNETGVLIWQLLGDGLDTGAITRKICATYDVSAASAAKSVSDLIDNLLKEELLLVG